MEDRNVYPQNTVASDLIEKDQWGNWHYKSNPQIMKLIKKVKQSRGLFGLRIVRKADLDNLCSYANMLVLYRQNLLEIQLMQNRSGKDEDVVNGRHVKNVISPR